MRQYVSIRHSGSVAQVPTAWVLTGLVAPTGAVLAGLWLQPWIALDDLIQAGAFSSLRSLLWLGTAAICGFTTLMARLLGSDRALFFLVAALVTLWLGLDDAFLIDEAISSFLHIPETAAYAALVGAYLLMASRRILSGRPSLFVTAVVLVGASLHPDILVNDEAAMGFVAEALKLAGAALWAGFHLVAAATAIEDLATGRITTVDFSAQRLTRTFPTRRVGDSQGI